MMRWTPADLILTWIFHQSVQSSWGQWCIGRTSWQCILGRVRLPAPVSASGGDPYWELCTPTTCRVGWVPAKPSALIDGGHERWTCRRPPATSRDRAVLGERATGQAITLTFSVSIWGRGDLTEEVGTPRPAARDPLKGCTGRGGVRTGARPVPGAGVGVALYLCIDPQG